MWRRTCVFVLMCRDHARPDVGVFPAMHLGTYPAGKVWSARARRRFAICNSTHRKVGGSWPSAISIQPSSCAQTLSFTRLTWMIGTGLDREAACLCSHRISIPLEAKMPFCMRGSIGDEAETKPVQACRKWIFVQPSTLQVSESIFAMPSVGKLAFVRTATCRPLLASTSAIRFCRRHRRESSRGGVLHCLGGECPTAEILAFCSSNMPNILRVLQCSIR